MSIPARGAVETDVCATIAGDEAFRQARRADGAEDRAAPANRFIRITVPPALMAKLQHVALPAVELREQSFQPTGGVSEARRELKQEAAHLPIERRCHI